VIRRAGDGGPSAQCRDSRGGVGQTAEGGGGGGGGGGSSYIDPSGITHAATYGGENGNYYGTSRGAPMGQQAMDSPYYLAGIGWGGGNSGRSNGGNGQVVIEWGKKAHSKPKPSPAPSPSPAPVPPSHHPLPITGFPFVQLGIAALALIGVGAMATWRSRQRKQL
jgi:hypothetical protein